MTHKLDPADLQALHQEFYEPVTRYIQFKVSDPHMVEDLSGEVFVRVLAALRRGQGWRDTPRGWIMGLPAMWLWIIIGNRRVCQK